MNGPTEEYSVVIVHKDKSIISRYGGDNLTAALDKASQRRCDFPDSEVRVVRVPNGDTPSKVMFIHPPLNETKKITTTVNDIVSTIQETELTQEDCAQINEVLVEAREHAQLRCREAVDQHWDHVSKNLSSLGTAELIDLPIEHFSVSEDQFETLNADTVKRRCIRAMLLSNELRKRHVVIRAIDVM